MIMDGLKVTLIGMSVVFLMLGSIIASVYVSAWFIRRFEKPSPPGSSIPTNEQAAPKNAGVIAAISAAIFRHRRAN